MRELTTLRSPKPPNSTSRENNTLTFSATCHPLLVFCPPGIRLLDSLFRSAPAVRCGSLKFSHLFGCLFGPAVCHILLVLCPSGVCLNRNLLGAMSRHKLVVPCSSGLPLLRRFFGEAGSRRLLVSRPTGVRLHTSGNLQGATNCHILLISFPSGGSLIFRFIRFFP